MHTVRYEDLRMNPLASLMGMLAFILPPEELPSLEQVVCALENDPEKVRACPENPPNTNTSLSPSPKMSQFQQDPYRSRKSPIFDAWDKYEEETRNYFLDLVKEPWCKFG